MENKKNLDFNDAQKLAIEFPETFEAPIIDDLNNLKVGDSVKVCINVPQEERDKNPNLPVSERFWTKIISIEGEDITASVDNDLYVINLAYKEVINFKKCHIYSTY